jgi:predicted metal-dependent hydrolase
MSQHKIHRLDHSKAQKMVVSTSFGEITYFLLRSSRRKTIEISVNEQEQVRVIAPVYATQSIVESFVYKRADWILRRVKEVQQINQFINNRDYDTGHEFLFLGKKYPLYVRESDRKRANVNFDDHGWIVNISERMTADIRRQKVKNVLIKWYRREAMEVFGSRVFHFVRIMGLEPMTLAVKTQKRIWGCCYYHDKRIFLNWLLVLAPVYVIDYVIVHELAHLMHPNHSKRFWNKVEKYLPDYKERQDWLKNHMMEMKMP